MVERRPSPADILYVILRFPLFATGILGAFTFRQRQAILERDDHRCQSPIKHECNEEQGLEVDHILPQRYLFNLGVDPDFPENALTKCKNAHDIKHPDRVIARRSYHQKKQNGVDAFQELQVMRDEQLRQRIIYWNDNHDRQDQVVAMKRTQRARQNGWEFPEKAKKK